MNLYFTFKFRNSLSQFSTPIRSENLVKLNMIVIPAKIYLRGLRSPNYAELAHYYLLYLYL